MTRYISRVAGEAAVAWTVYGLLESGLSLAGQAVMRRWTSQGLEAGAFVVTGDINPLGTAAALCVYPLAGAAFGVLAGALAVRFGRSSALADVSNARRLGSLAGCVSLCLVFVLHLLRSSDPAGLGVTVTLAVLAISCLLGLRVGSVATALILIGVAFLAQPRAALPPPMRGVVEALSAIGIVASAALARRLWRGRLVPVWTRNLPIHRAAGLSVTACTLLAVNVAAWPRFSAAAPASAAAGVADRPNVILITLDTVRADHLSLYGYGRDTTPNLRQFATHATVYTRALSTSNYTLPSHASIFTGLGQGHHGAREGHSGYRIIYPISPRVPTVAEVLAREGYLTGGVVANFAYLAADFGFARGFASYDTMTRRSIYLRSIGRPYLLREAVTGVLATLLRDDGVSTFTKGQGITQEALRFIDAAGGRQPFFLFVNYMDAHDPYVPPPPYDVRFPGKDASFQWPGYAGLVDDVSEHRTRHLTERERQHLISQYDGSIAYLDDQLARLFEHLRTAGLFDNTMIIVTSDHGEAFDEHDSSIMSHGVSLYQHQIHVPLIIKYPRASIGTTIETAVSGADLMPTILGVVGVAQPPLTDGRRIDTPAAAQARPPVISESYWPNPRKRIWNGAMTEASLSAGSLQLILRADAGVELYDLSSDPEQRTNIVGRRAIPEEWTSTLLRVLSEALPLDDGTAVRDPQAMERLRALGYIR